MLGAHAIADLGLCAIPFTAKGTPPVPYRIDLDHSGVAHSAKRTYLGPTEGALLTEEPFAFSIPFQSLSFPLAVGAFAYILPERWFRIDGWFLSSEVVTDLSVDIWKITLTEMLAGTPPTSADSITGGDYPALIASASAQSGSLSLWDRYVTPADVLVFAVHTNPDDLFRFSFSLQGKVLKLQ